MWDYKLYVKGREAEFLPTGEVMILTNINLNKPPNSYRFPIG